MRRYILATIILLAFAGTAHAAAPSDPSPSEPRVALVIGNGGDATSPLENPANDARLIARTLRELGFQVIEQADANHKGMGRIRRWSRAGLIMAVGSEVDGEWGRQ